jgi:hypothetical protein
MNVGPAYRRYLSQTFSWNGEEGCFKTNTQNRNQKVVVEGDIYNFVVSQHIELAHLHADGLYSRIQDFYYGIPREVIRNLVRRYQKCFPSSEQAIAEEIHAPPSHQIQGCVTNAEIRLPSDSLDLLRWIGWLSVRNPGQGCLPRAAWQPLMAGSGRPWPARIT